MKKKTLEELRASNAERQARWRGKHKWLAEQRRLAVYGKSTADKKAVLIPEMVQETFRAGIEGVDTAYGEETDERERGAYPRGGTAVQRGVAQKASGGLREAAVTKEEREVARRLEELLARQARGGLNAGVEVELDI